MVPPPPGPPAGASTRFSTRFSTGFSTRSSGRRSTSAATRAATGRVARRWRLGVTLVKVGVGSAVVVTMLGSQLIDSSSPSDAAAASDSVAARIDRLMAQQDCSYTGFGSDTIPATALLRTGTEEVKVVSFARGWAAYEGHKPGTLIAVCRGR